MFFSPKTSADGLVFHYDTGNTVRSYLGEPTTNLAYAVNSYLNSNSNWWINAGNATFNDNDTSIQKPTIPNVDTSNLRIFSSTVTGTGGNQQLGSSIITVSSSTTYSFSIYYYFTGTTMQVQPYVRTAVNNDLLAYFGYNGDTNYLNWPRNKWILLKATVTTQANENGIYMSSYTGDTLGEKLAYFGYQVEQKSHCTPLVLGTRSATQGLKDLTAKNTIDISTVSFDSNAQMTFDGTDDEINTGITTQLTDFSCEVVFKNNNSEAWGRIVDKSYTDGFFISSYFATSGIGYVGAGIIEPSPPHGQALQYDTSKYNYFVVTRSGTTHTIYLNGSTNSLSKTGSSTALSTAEMAIGAYSGTYNSQRFTGEIPVTKIYNRALTADEVTRNFNAIKSRFNIG